jgi:hypothetical protein
MPILFYLLVLLFSSSFAAPPFKLEQLQGAWWSDLNNITADFGIDGDQVWLDSLYYPCRIDGDRLIFELPDDVTVIKKIISLDGDRLVVEDEMTKQSIVLTRVKS